MTDTDNKPTIPTEQPKQIRCVACGSPIAPQANRCPVCRSKQRPSVLDQLKKTSKWIAGILTLASLLLGVNTLHNLYRDWQDKQLLVEETITSALTLKDFGDYRASWQMLQQTRQSNPGSRRLQKALADISLIWLQDIKTLNDETYSQFVDPMIPILARELVHADTTYSSYLRAHLAWSWFLQELDRRLLNPDPDSIEIVTRTLQHALQEDPNNYFAHAYWAFVVMYDNADIQVSLEHLNQAVTLAKNQHSIHSKEFAWMRAFQWRVLSLRLTGPRGTSDEKEVQLAVEMLRVANQMRINNEARPGARIVNLLFNNYGHRHSGGNVESLASAIPTDQHLQTFDWLFAQGDFESSINTSFLRHYQYIRARLLELNNKPQQALSILRPLAQLDINQELNTRIDNAIYRLSGSKTARAKAREARQYINDPIPADVDLWQFHHDTLLNFEPDILGGNIKDALAYFNNPQQTELLDALAKTYKMLRQVKHRVRQWIETKNQEVKQFGYSSSYSKSSEDNAYENLYAIWELVGLYALLTGHFEQAVAELTDLSKTLNPVAPTIYYHLAQAQAKLSEDSSSNEQRQLALSYLTQYIQSKVRYGGALNFDDVKSDELLASIRTSKQYRLIMRGR